MNQFEIDSYIEKLALNKNVKSFYPITICKVLKFPFKVVMCRLNKLVDIGYLKLKFEIRCDNFDLIDIVDSYENYIEKQVECEDCDSYNEFTVGLDNIFPIYYITDSYREYVKKKNVSLEKKVYSDQSQVSMYDYELIHEDIMSLKDILLEVTDVSSDNIEKVNEQIKGKSIVDKVKDVQAIVSLSNGIHQSYQYVKPYVEPLFHHFINICSSIFK